MASNIFDELKLKHRLLNTQKSASTSYLNEGKRSSRKRMIIMVAIAIGLISLVWVGQAAYRTFFTTATEFEYTSKGQVYSASPLSDSTIDLERLVDGEESSVDIEYFVKEFKPSINKKGFLDHMKSDLWSLLLGLGLYSTFLVYLWLGLRKSNRLRDIIDKE